MAALKLMTLNVALRDSRVTTSSFADDATLLEHDVVLWDPSRIERLYESGTSYRDTITLSDDGTARFSRDVARRRRDFADFLQLKRSLVVLVPPEMSIYYGTGTTENEGTKAKPRLKRIVAEFDITQVIPGELTLRTSRGGSFQLMAGSPFADFWRTQRDLFAYESVIEEHPGDVLLTVNGTSSSVAAHATVNGGQVWYLPRPANLKQAGHPAFVDALLRLVADSSAGEETAPAWTSRFHLPGEAEVIAKLVRAEESVERAMSRRDSQRASLARVQRSKQLVTASGKQLELAVTEALSAIGAEVEEGAPNRTDRILRWKGKVAVVEIKGLGKSAGEKDAAQLEKWVSTYIEEHEVQPKAILIANAWRNLPLDERVEPAFPEQMIPYAQGRKQSLVSASQLLCAVFSGDPAAFLDAVFVGVGRLEGFQWEDAVSVVEDGE